MFRYSNTALVAAILAAVGVVSYAATTPSRKENNALVISKVVQTEYRLTKALWIYDVVVGSGAWRAYS